MNCRAGYQIGNYMLLDQCGQGAYGAVFLAKQAGSEKKVALKIVYTHGRSCEREYKGLLQYQTVCRQTNLMQIYHVKRTGDYFWYTMDAADDMGGTDRYVPDTLANRLHTSGRLSPESVKTMVLELAEGLETLHRLGVFHRDIKPDNVLWISGRAMPGDIGLVTDSASTTLAGTPAFLPPDVLAGLRSYCAADDFYSLGKVAYCALTGMPVEKYPSFPADIKLTDCGNLIALYHALCEGHEKLCTGEKIRKFLQNPNRLRELAAGLCVIGVLVAGGLLLFALLHTKQSANVPLSFPQQEELSIPSKQAKSRSVPEKDFYTAGFEKISQQELFPNLSYTEKIEKIMKQEGPPPKLAAMIPKLSDWYLAHQSDYISEPLTEEKIQSVQHEMKKTYHRSLNRDEFIQNYRKRYLSYQNLSACQKAAWNYIRQYFTADILRTGIYKNPPYDTAELEKLFQKWLVEYRKLKPLEKMLLPVLNEKDFE